MVLLKNLFKKSRNVETLHATSLHSCLSALYADMHSHLIPGIDDGAKTMDDSIELIKELHLLGYKKLITTPHINCDHYKNTPEIILDGLKKVREAVINENIPVEIQAAA